MLKNRFQRLKRGFTLVELLLVMGLATVLFLLSSVNLTNLIPKASVTGTEETLIADLKYQQQKAMLGETEGRSTSDRYGIYFHGSTYTLFHGDIYSSSDTANADQDFGDTLSFGTTFPSNSVIFEQGSGEIVGFIDGQNSITISHNTGETKTVVLNWLGVVVGD